MSGRGPTEEFGDSTRLLLLSNSTMAGEAYLGWVTPHLDDFLGSAGEVLFVPYAAVTIDYDAYTEKVSAAMPGRVVTGIHTVADKIAAVENASAIIVGGGNTFSLLCRCQEEALLEPIRAAVRRGTRYAGWSAGANLACPTIKTTNDMPIEAPDGLDALDLVPFQINPHFTRYTPPGHGGETRAERIHEFLLRNPRLPVVGLPEGTLLEIRGEKIVLRGREMATLFRHGREAVDLAPGPIVID